MFVLDGRGCGLCASCTPRPSQLLTNSSLTRHNHNVCVALQCPHPRTKQVASRQRKREAAAAARAAGISPEEAAAAAAEAEDAAASGFYNADDEVMGAGFSAFVARDEDSEAGVLYYEDELDGDIPEADLIDRDEAEEEDGEGQ